MLSAVPRVLIRVLGVHADPFSGFLFNIQWFQLLGYNDPPVNPPTIYHTVVTFAVSATI